MFLQWIFNQFPKHLLKKLNRKGGSYLLLEKLKSHIILIGIVLMIILVMFFKRPLNQSANSFDLETNDPLTSDITSEEKPQQVVNEKVIIDIKGEVKNPGVYEITSQARVNDVILMAGGLTNQADEYQVNLAEIVYDEMVIFIPAVGEIESGETGQGMSDKIHVNRATTTELESLSGIGPSKAAAIINYRDEHGKFQSVEDLLNVPGIGQKTLDNIVDDLQIP